MFLEHAFLPPLPYVWPISACHLALCTSNGRACWHWRKTTEHLPLGQAAAVRSMARVSNSGYRFCHIARSIEDNRILLTLKGHGTMHLIAIKECQGVVDLDLVVLSCIGATPPVAKPHNVFFSSSFS